MAKTQKTKTQKTMTVEIEVTMKDNDVYLQAKEIASEVIRMTAESMALLTQLTEIITTTKNPLILGLALDLGEQLSQLTGETNARTVGVSSARTQTTSARNPKVPS